MDKTVSFTGHRPEKLGGYNPSNPVAQKVKAKLKTSILEAIQEGYQTFISGGALGVDQWAAEIVLELKKTHPIKLVIAKPFPSQSKVWNQESQAIFDTICAQADEVVNVCPDPYAAWKMQKRNEYMVNRSTRIIAVWDGSSGGTANAVHFARNQKKQLIQINPKNL